MNKYDKFLSKIDEKNSNYRNDRFWNDNDKRYNGW